MGNPGESALIVATTNTLIVGRAITGIGAFVSAASAGPR
jgi:hypothetical protein